MMIIDPPVTPFSPEAELRAWLEALAEMPQDEQAVIDATAQARAWIVAAEARERG